MCDISIQVAYGIWINNREKLPCLRIEVKAQVFLKNNEVGTLLCCSIL